MFKEMLLKKMLKSRMGNVPDEQLDAVIKAVSKNPDLFKKIGDEIEEGTKSGRDQMEVSMEVMRKYKDQLKGLM